MNECLFCPWAHARRKLFELTVNNVAPIAEEGIKQIKTFYRIEAQIRGMPADERRVVLSRFSSGLFRAMFAMKEIENGKEIHRRVSA
ncbi:IS66 family transposase [Halocynthiibacter namhaensis]|uniref:IS66 family transposase n=1 Tax=Halocynthiibacter namhaensis TaxID=1290553 RepID=UPI0009E01D0C